MVLFLVNMLLKVDRSSIIDCLVKMRTNALQPSSAVTSSALLLAVVFSLILTVKLGTDIMGGKKNIVVMDFAKPLLIMLAITCSGAITAVVDSVANLVGASISVAAKEMRQSNFLDLTDLYKYVKESEDEDTARIVGTSADDIGEDATAGDVERAIGNLRQTADGEYIGGYSYSPESAGTTGRGGAKEEKEGFFKEVWDFFVGIAEARFKVKAKTKAVVLSQVMSVVFDLVSDGVMAFSQIYLTILACLLPFVLAFTVVPGLGDFMAWVARYLQVSLWCPIVQLINYVYQAAVHGLVGNFDALAFGAKAALPSMMNFMTLVCILMLFAIGNIAATAVQSTGLNGARDKMKGALTTLLTIIK